MSLIRRRGHSSLGMAPEPPPFPPVTVRQGWAPFAPQATPNVQVGAYAIPPRTQYPTNWPDRQLNCGVNGVSRSWLIGVPHGADKIQSQMTVFPQNPKHLIQSGARPGGTQPLTIMSDSFVPRSYAQGVQQGALAAGVLGW